jgi:hypothetical protein
MLEEPETPKVVQIFGMQEVQSYVLVKTLPDFMVLSRHY